MSLLLDIGKLVHYFVVQDDELYRVPVLLSLDSNVALGDELVRQR